MQNCLNLSVKERNYFLQFQIVKHLFRLKMHREKFQDYTKLRGKQFLIKKYTKGRGFGLQEIGNEFTLELFNEQVGTCEGIIEKIPRS